MITRVEIDGFKSFKGFAVELEPLTAVIGPNSVGKSNLFDALQLLSRTLDMDLVQAFQHGRGRIADQFRRTVEKTVGSMTFAVEVLLSSSTAGCDVVFGRENLAPDGELLLTRLRYELRIDRKAHADSSVEDLVVAYETIDAIRTEDDAWIARHPELARLARYGIRDKPLLLSGHINLRASVRDTEKNEPDQELVAWNGHGGRIEDGFSTVLGISPGATAMRSMGALFGPHLWALSREIRGWRFLQVNAVELRDSSERAAGVVLSSDGSNLPTVLAGAPVETTAQIQADLSDLMPGVKSFEVVPQGDDLSLEIQFSDGLRLPTRVLSDGTLRLIAFLTALRLAPPGSVVGIEEPENGLYPGRLHALVDRIIEAADSGATMPVQILLNSHSPTVLAALHGRPRSIRFADAVRRGEPLLSSRMRPVRERSGPIDRAATIDLREIERILDTIRPDEAA